MQALIAFINRGEEKNLRKLEIRLLEHGITVTPTAYDLVRYHGKMFVIDKKELHLLAFNHTHLAIALSGLLQRSFLTLSGLQKRSNFSNGTLIACRSAHPYRSLLDDRSQN